MRRGYAALTELEYFAEMTVAYYSRKLSGVSYQGVYFPFYRSQLRSYDPFGYDLCKKIWNTNFENLKNKYVETNLTKCHKRCKWICKRKLNINKSRNCRKKCIINCNIF